MRKPSSILVGGKRVELLPPRKPGTKKPRRPPMTRDRGGEVRLGPTAQQQLEALARLYGSTLNHTIAHCITVCYDGALTSARDRLTSPYAADRIMAKENLAVLKGAKRNTARNLRDR